MLRDHAGEVLYNWRVFPLHLDEAPVISLRKPDSRTGGNAELAPDPDMDTDTQQERAETSRKELLQREGSLEQPGEQQGIKAASGSKEDECIAWPEDGGHPDGPVVYR